MLEQEKQCANDWNIYIFKNRKKKKSTNFPLRCAQHLRAACPARKRQTFGDVCHNADHLSKVIPADAWRLRWGAGGRERERS